MRAIKITHLNVINKGMSTFARAVHSWAFLISFAYFWKASPKQKTAEAKKGRNCPLRLTCCVSVFAMCAIIALAAQAQAFSLQKRYRKLMGRPLPRGRPYEY
jgi:hypothetical protein